MTTDPPTVDRIPLAHSVVYAVRGAPEIGDEYNATRTIAPTEITLTYWTATDSQLGRIHAYVKGWWMEDGARVPMDKPVGRHLYGDPEAWPAWLAEEARLHDPAAVSVPPPADRAAILREAAEDLATAFGDPKVKHIGTIAASHLRRRARELEGGEAGEEQPETPLEKRFRHSERRNDELRAECKRRGRINLEYAEKVERLEKQLDEVRTQLGAEILRAGQAEAELRRLAAEAQPGPGVDLIEDYLKFLRGQGPEPDLSGLTEEQRAVITGQFGVVRALADRDPELPPLDRDPVARRLGLHEQPAAEAQQPEPKPAIDLHALTRQVTAIWGETPTPLPHAVTILTVVAGDVARQARNEAEGRPVDLGELGKEFGNWILTTIRAMRDAGLDPDQCVTAALQAQQRYAAEHQAPAVPVQPAAADTREEGGA